MSVSELFACPYCDAMLNGSALSCRCCGRDLTPVLPLLRRLSTLESRLASFEETLESSRLALPAPAADAAESINASAVVTPVARRRFLALPLGLLVLLAAYWMVVLWLDLPLAVLRFVSIAIPFGVGLIYLGVRPRLTWLDVSVAVFFALAGVAAMNALLGWSDNIPMLPQGVAAWRETFFYALSIGASMFAGMLLRVSQAALTARGLASLPELRKGLLAVKGNVPMDTLKAIELTILLASTALSVITGMVAGLLGVK
jgi:hypothetical protein